MSLPPDDIPFSLRRFHLDGVLIDIEDFISCNSENFDEAAILRSDICDMPCDYHMILGGGACPERDLYRAY